METTCKKETATGFLKDHAEDTVSNDLGLSIIPVTSQKSPLKGWKQYQTTIAPVDQWHSHYLNGGYVGVICGSVSSGLECIDIDIKNDPLGTIHKEYFDLIPSDLMSKLIVQTTPNNGFHLIYRCKVIESNQVLAKDQSGEVIIETRGEGGYFCTHMTDYSIVRGQLDLKQMLVDIPIITKNEREVLLESARSLTRHFKKQDPKSFTYNEPAINAFNDKYDIGEVLQRHGWSKVNEDGSKQFWLREGSIASHSAYYFMDSKVFYCFSTSTEFTAEKPYNHFQILQLLEGSNDYKTTLRLLPKYGFELSNRPSKVKTDDIAEYLNNNGVVYDEFLQDLTYNGEILTERDYNTIFLDMKKHFDREVPRTRYDEVIKSAYINSYNPIDAFIEDHKHLRETGVIEHWFDCLTLKNKDVDRQTVLKYIKRWFVGIIAQATDGQFPNEYFLTLLSTEHGIGKTSLLRNNTLPLDLQQYVVEHALTFDDDFKVIMGQSLLIIDDEMDGKTWENMKSLKTVLSSKKVTTRRKYDRRVSNIFRHCSFAGSGNHLHVIKEYQNRRIIPIEIEHIDFEQLEKVDLDALFMEAYWLYKDGFQYSYQIGDIAELKHLYEDYVQHSDLDLLLDEYFEKPISDNDVWLVYNMDIVSGLQAKYPALGRKINAIAIGKMLNERGFEMIKHGRRKLTCYAVSTSSKVLQLMNMDMESASINAPKSNAQQSLSMINKRIELVAPNHSNLNSDNHGR